MECWSNGEWRNGVGTRGMILIDQPCPLLHNSITPFPHLVCAWNFGETRQYEPDDSDSDVANDPARNR